MKKVIDGMSKSIYLPCILKPARGNHVSREILINNCLVYLVLRKLSLLKFIVKRKFGVFDIRKISFFEPERGQPACAFLGKIPFDFFESFTLADKAVCVPLRDIFNLCFVSLDRIRTI